MNTVTVTFTKTFKSGLLEGLTVPQSISFATREAACKFARKIDGKRNTDCVTGAKFVYGNVEVL